jgi:hypothetical protein
VPHDNAREHSASSNLLEPFQIRPRTIRIFAAASGKPTLERILRGPSTKNSRCVRQSRSARKFVTAAVAYNLGFSGRTFHRTHGHNGTQAIGTAARRRVNGMTTPGAISAVLAWRLIGMSQNVSSRRGSSCLPSRLSEQRPRPASGLGDEIKYAASGIANQRKASVTGETVTVTVVKGIVESRCAGVAFADREGKRGARGVAEGSKIAARRPDGNGGVRISRTGAGELKSSRTSCA